MESASLRGAVLLRADFRETRLAHADLRGARATGIRLDGAHMLGARIHGLDLGTEPPSGLPSDICDASRAGDNSEQSSLTELFERLNVASRMSARAMEGIMPRRYVGAGDVLKNAELVFGGSAEVLVDGVLRQCEVRMTEAGTLIIGESGLLDGCRVTGGCIRVHGRFLAPGSVGLIGPAELLVFEHGLVATQLEQHRGGTRFGFAHGCRLRLNIKTHSPPASER